MIGGTSPKQCRKAALRICKRINQACYGDVLNKATSLKPFAVYHFQINNVVCAFKSAHKLAIEQLYLDYCRRPREFNRDGWKVHMTYRPTSFTAVRIKFQRCETKKEKIALMIFINGNVTISGYKTEQASQFFAEYLCEVILSKYNRLSQLLS